MYSESSDDPSSHVIRSKRSTKTRFRTLALALFSEEARASLRACAEAM